VLWVGMKVFQTALLMFAILFQWGGRTAWCARPDAISSSTAVNSGYFIESLFVHKHFAALQDADESFFSRHRDTSDEEPDELTVVPVDGKKPKKPPKPKAERLVEKKKDEPFQPSGLSWELGYAYASPLVLAQQPVGVVAPTSSLDSQSIVAGLDWEALPELDMGMDVQIDTLPNQDYRHGRITLRFEYLVPVGMSAERQSALAKLREGQEQGDETDARAYYLNRADSSGHTLRNTRYLGGYHKKGTPPPSSTYSDDNEDPESVSSLQKQLQGTYPNLKMALVFSFDRHILQTPTFQAMNQFELGPDLNLDLSADTRFHLLAFYSGYSTSVQSFSAQLPVSPGISIILPASSFSAFQPQFLAYPTFVFEEGVSHDLNDAWTIEFYANQVFYALSGESPVVGLAPMIFFSPSSHWTVGLGGDLLLGGSGTSGAGILNLSYLF